PVRHCRYQVEPGTESSPGICGRRARSRRGALLQHLGSGRGIRPTEGRGGARAGGPTARGGRAAFAFARVLAVCGRDALRPRGREAARRDRMTDIRQERKVVTVLFADLVGFTARAETLDPEDVAAVLRPYHERLRSELERFGGTVEKFIGDAVMALFGAPVAHEDDPERAVRAALAIRDWAREDDAVQVRIAVNTGEALINLGARPEAGEGMAAGDVVNTTARLQSAAPVNGVIVGETTYRATQPVIDYRDVDAVEAKGKAEPLQVWEALEPRSRVETEAVSTH